MHKEDHLIKEERGSRPQNGSVCVMKKYTLTGSTPTTPPTKEPVARGRFDSSQSGPRRIHIISMLGSCLVALERPATFFAGRTALRFITDSYSAMCLSYQTLSYHTTRVG